MKNNNPFRFLSPNYNNKSNKYMNNNLNSNLKKSIINSINNLENEVNISNNIGYGKGGMSSNTFAPIDLNFIKNDLLKYKDFYNKTSDKKSVFLDIGSGTGSVVFYMSLYFKFSIGIEINPILYNKSIYILNKLKEQYPGNFNNVLLISGSFLDKFDRDINEQLSNVTHVYSWNTVWNATLISKMFKFISKLPKVKKVITSYDFRANTNKYEVINQEIFANQPWITLYEKNNRNNNKNNRNNRNFFL